MPPLRKPLSPPDLEALIRKFDGMHLLELLQASYRANSIKYYHWDTLRHLEPPNGLSHEEWWLSLKLARGPNRKMVPLRDREGKPFSFVITDEATEYLHKVDQQASGAISVSEEVTNPATRDRYVVNSLIEEAITSSQLEGAATTRRVAKDMIRSGRRPIDRDERMILNNYNAMQYISSFAVHSPAAAHAAWTSRISVGVGWRG
jgi:Fic family protein